MAVLNLQEDGKIQMLYNKWWKSTGKCNKDDKTNSKASALGVENVGGIFVVLLAGLTLAVFIAMIEFMVKSKRNAAEDKVRIIIAPDIAETARRHRSSIEVFAVHVNIVCTFHNPLIQEMPLTLESFFTLSFYTCRKKFSVVANSFL